MQVLSLFLLIIIGLLYLSFDQQLVSAEENTSIESRKRQIGRSRLFRREGHHHGRNNRRDPPGGSPAPAQGGGTGTLLPPPDLSPITGLTSMIQALATPPQIASPLGGGGDGEDSEE